MALSNYGELKTSIAAWLNRDDLEDQIPDFIALFEAKFDADPRTATHRRRICRSSAEISNEYETLAENFLAPQSVSFDLDPEWRLENITPEELVNRKQTESDWQDALDDEWDAIKGSAETAQTPPKYYAIVGTEIRFFPPPAQTYTALMTVYERLDTLSDDTDTNWALTYFPHCYLYGALLEAAPYLSDDARIPVWQALYGQAIAALEGSDPIPADPNVIRTDTPPLRQAFSQSTTFRP